MDLRNERNRWLGCCENNLDLIIVNLECTGPIYRGKWFRKGKAYRWKPKKWNQLEATRTLVHELVHYRWPRCQDLAAQISPVYLDPK